MPALLAALIGASIGLAAGGRFSGLLSLQLRTPVPILVLYVVQGALRGRLPVGGHLEMPIVAGWGLASLLLIVIVARDASQLRGLWLLVTGWTLNLLVVMLNGGMPVIGPGEVRFEGRFYHIASQADHLLVLSDTMPAGRLILSIGDVVVLTGLAVVIAGGFLSRNHDSCVQG